MSKICLITAQNVQMSPDSLRRRIVDLSAERNIGAFFPTTSNVGLTEYEDAFVCSISDDFLYDNCERLLLPDDCWYNGTCSSAPFAERMNSVCDIVRYAADYQKRISKAIRELQYVRQRFGGEQRMNILGRRKFMRRVRADL